MNIKKSSIIFTLILFFLPLILWAASEQGINGPLHTTTAWNLAKGDFTFHYNSRFYYNNKNFIQADGQKTGTTYWDVQGGMNVFYGLINHFQLGLAQIFYQDNHKSGKGYNIPDDMFLSVKAGSFSLKNKSWNFGANVFTRIPLAKYHNVILEPYSAGKIELGVFALTSFTTNPSFPQDGFNGHLNLGIIDHNDHATNLDPNKKSTVLNKHNSREIVGSLALVYPTSKFNFSAELYGNFFITKPPATAYSRHSYLYFTPGINFKAINWLSFAFGFDVRLTPHKSSSNNYLTDHFLNLLPTYPLWRLNFKTRLNINSVFQKRSVKKDNGKKTVTVEKDEESVYQQIDEEKKNIKNARQELEILIKERERMDEILFRLRKALDKEKEENIPKKEKK